MTPNADAANDVSDVFATGVGFTKAIVSSEVDEANNNGVEQATIGEEVTYSITVTVPQGTTIYGSPLLNDIVSSRLVYSAGSAAGTFDDDGAGPDVPTALPGAVVLTDTAGNLKLQFPTTYTNANASGDDVFVVTFKARIADVAANGRTPVSPDATLPNQATFAWEDQAASSHTETSTANATVVEPVLSLAKADDDADNIVSPGQTIRYTVTASNGNATGTSTAYDIVVVDHVPAGLTPLDAGGNPVTGDGDVVKHPTSTPDGVWSQTNRTITWTLASLARNTSKALIYDAKVDSPSPAATTFANSATATTTSMAGTHPGERGPGSTRPAGYTATATDTVRLLDASTAKSVTPSSATPGESVSYTIDVTLPPNIDFFDTTVLDTVPDGVDFDSLTSIACTPSCSPAITGSLIPEADNLDGSTTVGYFLGDIASSATERVVHITYAAHVDDVYEPEDEPVTAAQTLTNAAKTFYNGVSRIAVTPTTNPAPGDFDSSTNTATSAVTVVEPAITLDKDVSGDANDDDTRATQPGDAYTYSIKVKNTGTSAAYDVKVTDQPSALLTSVVVATSALWTVDDGWLSGNPSIAWTIGVIAPGDTVTLTYTADLVASSLLHDGDTVLNTADVAQFYGLDDADRARTDDSRTYTTVPDDTVTLTVDLPQVQIEKYAGSGCTAESANAQVLQPFTWCIVVTNTSTAATLHDFDVVDSLPANWDYVASSATFTPGAAVEPSVTGATATGRTLTWSNVGDLAPGNSATLTFQAKPLVAAATNPGTGAANPHDNTATATGDDASGAPGAAGGVTYTDTDAARAVLQLPALSITKLPDAGTATAGAASQWTIAVTNSGDDIARNLVITDVLPAGVAYTAGAATAAFAPAGSGAGFTEDSLLTDTPTTGRTTVLWGLDTLAVGATVTITVPVSVDADVPANTTLANTASVFSDEAPTPVTDPGSLDVATSADLSIVKSDAGVTATAGQPFDYALTVHNNGPSDAQSLSITDTLPAELTPKAPLPSGCAFDSATRVFSCSRATLAAGADWVTTLTVDVASSATASPISNTAAVTTTTTDPVPANNTSTQTTPLTTSADLRLQKSAAPSTILQGDLTTYTLLVTNDGPSDATAASVTDTVPPELDVQSVSGPAGSSCAEAPANTITCTLGTIPAGASRTITVIARGVTVGTHTNSAIASSSTTDPTPANNIDSTPVTVLPMADLELQKTGPAGVTAGGKVTYTIDVINHGPSAAQTPTITDTLPAGTVYDDAASDPACDAGAGQTVVCALPTLASGATATVQITVGVPAALGATTIVNTATVASPTGDSDPADNTDGHPVTVSEAADLSIVKTQGVAVAGSPLIYTLVIQNAGPSRDPAVKVLDTLPAGLEFRGATPSQGSCTASGQAVTCELGALDAGGSAQIVVSALVAFDRQGQGIVNTATVSGALPDPDPSNNSSTVMQTAAEPGAGRSAIRMVKTASTAAPKLGEPFTYTLAVSNQGPNTATNVKVTDTLSTAVEILAVRGPGCTVDASTVTCTIPQVDVGETVKIEYDVKPISASPILNTASAVGDQVNPSVLGQSVDAVRVLPAAPRGSLSIRKKASRKVVRPGARLTWTITVTARTVALTDVRVCDRLPVGLAFVSGKGATLTRGQVCWQVGFLAAGESRRLSVVTRVARGAKPTLRNPAVATARNAATRRTSAAVRVRQRRHEQAPGGVTG